VRKVTLVDFSDLLRHATSLGYDWNRAHEIMVKDEVISFYDDNCELYKSEVEGNDYGWSDDSVKIIKSFMEANNVTKFTLTR